MESIKNLVENLEITEELIKLCKVQLLTCEDIATLKASEDWRLELKVNIEYDLAYDKLYIGQWNQVPEECRKWFQVLTCLKAFCIVRSDKHSSFDQFIKALRVLDIGIIIGTGTDQCQLLTSIAQLLHDLMGKFNKILQQRFTHCLFILVVSHPPEAIKVCPTASINRLDSSDIDVLSQPSEEQFWTKFLNFHRPVKLTNCFSHWPAMSKWNDLNYFLRTAGYRTVPIELGKKYDSDDWSQGMFRFGEFLRNFMSAGSDIKKSGYLAQHDLFDQIPHLRKDIFVPDFCAISSSEPVIKSWIGPANTISTMHTDDKHNLLCQVMGEKLVILASPDEASKLYQYDGLLNNTCQVDTEHLNYEEFPLSRDVKFFKLILRPGEMLYLPKLWFHYVRSLNPSISVSFWFDVDD